MTEQTNQTISADKEKKKWQIIAGVLAVCLVISLVFNFTKTDSNNTNSTAAAANSSDTAAAEVKTLSADVLDSWAEDSNAKNELVTLVSNAVDENSEGYIPVENRIAVFDMDGTLLSETSPYYIEWMMFFYHVLNDPNYDAPEDIKKFVTEVAIPAVNAGKVPDEVDAEFSKLQAKSYAGYTKEDYDALVQEFLKTPVNGQDGMTYGESFFEPMEEVVEYLKGNDFTVYVVSGADRMTTREIATTGLGLDPNHIIASDSAFVATNQNGEDGEFYTFTTGDEVVRGEDLIIKNLKMNKVSAINREIGIQPVLAFGNSSGDESMLLYTITDNEYPAEAFILMCDDTERDYGNTEKADSVKEMADKDGFNAVSMKDDFTTIYGPGVTKEARTDVSTESTK